MSTLGSNGCSSSRNALCKYFNCQVGDLLFYVPDEEETRGE
ncbi:MAG TPA: XRE family transcriptional regulator [Anaerolineae bacterium]|nr:XRE family transcriptional regulator [Anaerolineae bacterium]